MQRVLSVAVVIMLAAALPAQSGKDFAQTPEELQVFELTNKERKQMDLPALKLSPVLSKVARAHAENMARQGKMEHDLDEKKPFDRIKASGYKYSTAGENIAMAEKGGKLSRVMQLWMESKWHRENILSPAYTEIGVGIALDKDGNAYITQDFAKPR